MIVGVFFNVTLQALPYKIMCLKATVIYVYTYIYIHIQSFWSLVNLVHHQTKLFDFMSIMTTWSLINMVKIKHDHV